MDDEGVALLKELVQGPRAGEFFRYPNETNECCYCGSTDEWETDWGKQNVDHHPNCPVQRARDYLKRRQG